MATNDLGKELYEPLPGFILSQARAIGAREPPTAARDYVETFVKKALASSQIQHVDRLYDRKVRGKVLLLENTAKPPRGAPPAPKTVSAREARALRRDHINPKLPYTAYEPLYQLWHRHAATVLTAPNQHRAVHEQMEWRGCLATVVDARDPGVVGVTGIVVAVTRNTMTLVSKRDRHIVITRRYTSLAFEANGMRIMAPAD